MFRILMSVVISAFILSCDWYLYSAAQRAMDWPPGRFSSTGGGASGGRVGVKSQFIANENEGFFVKMGGAGKKDGTSWDNAFANLQEAIEAANNHGTKKKVYVAKGTYKPTGYPNGGNGEHEKHFSLRNGVKVIGGFPGEDIGESNGVDPSKTTLSGDINDTPNDISDDVYHIFYHPKSAGLISSAKLIGVTITRGNANGGGDHIYGGGIYNDKSSPELTNCTFTNNEATSGGGMYNHVSSPTLTNCTFTDNTAIRQGGGIRNFKSSPELTNCTFTNNMAGQEGGAVHSDTRSYPEFDIKTTRSFTSIGHGNPDGKDNGNVEE